MTVETSDTPLAEDPHAQLERAFIDEFLRPRGYSLATLRKLPTDQATELLREASLYASGRLTEVESRAHFVHDIHGGAPPVPGQAHRLRD